MNKPDSRQRSKTALVLAAGGVAGAMYEIGALRAIDDLLVQYSVNDFDIYIGTSAGALVASCLVNGISSQTLLSVLNNSVFDIHQLEPHHIFSFDPVSIVRRSTRLPVALIAMVEQMVREGKPASFRNLIETLAIGLPTGVYDTVALERYLRHIFTHSGRSNDFRTLSQKLSIIATDLNTGHRAVFGHPPFEDVPLSLAVCASAAIPLFYQPVRIGTREYIDGGIRGTVSLDVAIDQGAQLIICINPMVPLDNSQATTGKSFGDQGMQKIGNQVFRTFIHAGLHYHLKQVRRQHPEVDIILIEPQRDDPLMFENTMQYDTRVAIACHGFESVAHHLMEHEHQYRELLAHHGLRINPRRASATLQTLRQARGNVRAMRAALIAQPISRTHPIKLGQTLAELDGLLSQLEYNSIS